jgi:hypothetical protein
LEFLKIIKTIDGWDNVRFLVYLENILKIQFTEEQQEIFFSYFSPVFFETIGEWVRDLIIDWLCKICNISVEL